MRFIIGFITFILIIQQYIYADGSQNFFLGSRESDLDSIVENVSTIHGDYTEVEVDLTVASPDSLVLSRFYSSRDTSTTASFGGWRFIPHCYLKVEKDPKNECYSTAEGKFERTFVYVGSPEGSILTYVGWKNVTQSTKGVLFKIDAEIDNRGISNTARGDISAWTNLKNNELYYNPQNETFELSLCNEGKRYYVKNPLDSSYYLSYEILPSGNKIFYEYNDKSQLELIKQKNVAEKKDLAWIKIKYEESTTHIETSDGKTADYQFEQDSSGVKLLTAVLLSHKPHLHYQYRIVDDHALLVKKTLPEGRFVNVDYFSNQCKVKSVTTPDGIGGMSIREFRYDQGSTEVNGPGLCKSVYRHDSDAHLVAFEQYLNGALYRIQKKSWGKKSDSGNLISTSIADASGAIFYHKIFIYDNLGNGNIIEEREYGDISGTGAFILDIDEEGTVNNSDGSIKNFSYFSGKTTHGFMQRDAKGTGVKYWYKKGTNLLIKKLVLTKGSFDSEFENYNSGIKQRFFYAYNDDASLVQVITDDGKESDPNNFSSVKQRTITLITPKQEIPNIGTGEIIEQKYSSNDGKKEYLINKTVNRFDLQGNIVSQEVYDANGEYCYSIKKEYEKGLVVFETDPLGNETHYTYDENLNLKSEKYSPTGKSIEYRYDLRNRLIKTTENDKAGNQFSTEIVYDPAGYISREKDRFGYETTYVNDTLGRMISMTYPDENTYTYTYDLFDNPVSVTDSQGRIVTRKYNVKGKPAEINYLDGTKEIFRYDSGGNLHHHYCRNGIVEVFEYDYAGRISKIEYYRKGFKKGVSSFKNISYSYNSFHLDLETDARGKKSIYTYDGCGRIASIKKENQKVDFTYDSLGRTNSTKKWKNPKEFTLEVKEYDLLDRVIEERMEDSNGNTLLQKNFIYNQAGELAQIIGYPQNQKSILMQFEYDRFGRVIKATNGVGNSTHISYDDAFINEVGRRVIKMTTQDPNGNCTEEFFDYNEHLLRTSIKDKSNNLLSCIDTPYDSAGNKIIDQATIVPNGNFEIAYSYNQGNQPEAITIGKERTTRFEYSCGELSKKSYPETQSPLNYRYDDRGYLDQVSYKEGKKDFVFTLNYENNGNLFSVGQDNLLVSYKYDDNNLPISETVKDEFGSYQVTRIYDGEGQVKTLNFPDGSYVEYTYEGPFVKSASRFNKEKKEIYTHTVASRDQMGNITEEILPGHLGSRIHNWDLAGRKISISTDFFKDKVLEYDLLDNIKKRETTFETSLAATEYNYNQLLQLISEKGDIEHTYSYDSIGNRLSKDQSPYHVNSLNELIEAEGSNYTFHPNGNLATKATNGKTWTYQNNPFNQIISIKDDQTTLSLTYNLTGKRFSKRVDSKNKKKVLRFFYLDDTEIGCIDEKGVMLELKIPSNPNDPESPAFAIEVKKDMYVPIYDLQGNIVCLLDHHKRSIVESYRYSAYGEEVLFNQSGEVLSDSTVGNPWRFQGKRIEKEIGLIYFGYRYYDPEIGRWISPDPLGTIDGPNLYAFVRNNPIRYVDHFGYNTQTAENCGCTQHGHPGWHHAPPGCVCICGRNGAIEAVAGSYRSRMGSGIKSTLGGLSHGVIDFMIGSCHDLLTSAAYIGSDDLDMTLHERIHMIEIIERSHMQQLSVVGNHYMDMLGIDESDSIYQSFRSTTTKGLEVVSLVAGGYGAVKGAISISKLARMPAHIARISKSISRLPSNPLQGTKYSRKVLLQMEANLKTGQPDFHGFPKLVDNYANLGQREIIRGRDGIHRLKINLDGGYKGQNGHFEWIIETDKSVNHRLFVPHP